MITVKLTPEQLRALTSCATGELESLTSEDERSGISDDLRSAVDALENARKGAK